MADWGGHARKRVADETPLPFPAHLKGRAARAVWFVETHCRPPKGYGAGEPMRLAPFQKAWLKQVLAPGVTAAVMAVPRGNGKSSFLAAVALWALFDPEAPGGAPQVPVVATTVLQAQRSCYGVAVAMLGASPELGRRALVFSGIGTMRVSVPSTGGEMFPVSSDPSTLQGLDPSLAICDEVGFQSVASWDSLLLASGKRPASLVVGIGTPGFDRDNALWHLREVAAAGGGPDGFVFTEFAAPDGCDVRDEKAWRVANPALRAGYMNVKALRTAVDLAPEAHFRTFRLGQWVDGVDCWLGPDAAALWKSLEMALEASVGDPTWIGLDVGYRHDSTALVAVRRRPDGRLHAVAQFWIPPADGAVELSHVMQALREMDKQYNVVEVAYDPRLFEVPAQMLAAEGLPMVEFSQSLERTTPAFGQLYEMIKRGELTHSPDPMFDRQVLAAIPRYNERGFTLAKATSRGKIDACFALMMAVDRALHAKPARPPVVVL